MVKVGEWGDGVVNPISFFFFLLPSPIHLCSFGHKLPYWEDGHNINPETLSQSFQECSAQSQVVKVTSDSLGFTCGITS